MGQTPDEIRGQIEQTRSEMGETAEALGYKANVPARTKGWVSDKKDAVVSAVAGTKDSVTNSAPDGQQIKGAGRRVVGIAQENPLGLAIAGAAIGFVAGLFTPSTRIEDEHLGATADKVKASAVEAGQEAIQHGKEVATAAVESARDTVRDESGSHVDELQESLEQKVHQATPAGR